MRTRSFPCAGRRPAHSTGLAAVVVLVVVVITTAACDSGEQQIRFPPDATPRPDAPIVVTCDPVAQDCADGEKPKCTVVTAGGEALQTSCLPQTGAQGPGEPCARPSDAPSGYGQDDCAPGLWCSGVGVLPPAKGGTRICRAFCNADADCLAGERCLGLLRDAEPPIGFCLPTCVLFAEPDTCGAGLTCGALGIDVDSTYVFSFCREVGTLGAGSACTLDAPCAAGLICLDLDGAEGPQSARCHSLCDASHACPAGTTCDALADLPNGGGLCR